MNRQRWALYKASQEKKAEHYEPPVGVGNESIHPPRLLILDLSQNQQSIKKYMLNKVGFPLWAKAAITEYSSLEQRYDSLERPFCLAIILLMKLSFERDVAYYFYRKEHEVARANRR